MIQVYIEQRAIFNHPANYSIEYEVAPYVFTEAPDWVVDSAMWRLLEKDRKAKVIGSAKDISTIDKADGKISKQEISKAIETAEESSVNDNELTMLSNKKAKELYEICVEKGLKVEPQKTKAYYLKALAE